MLVAISIPIFTAQLEKSRIATDEANIRNAYAELTAGYLAGSKSGQSNSKSVKMQHKDSANNSKVTLPSGVTGTAKVGSVTVKINANGVVSVN